jgi:trk system potassium uptake protein TrkH
VGPTDNYAWLPGAAKWVLVLCMLLGRLEIYTVLILFVPEFWRK